MRMPESLQLCRASSCTPERLDAWYDAFSSFMKSKGLQDKPLRIWNADESGFPLCPKTSRVLAMRNKKHVYSVGSDSKTQITTLVAANAAGSVIPPMHIFPGVRFRYNPLAGGVEGAYFGRSDSGWMVTELFYGWVANHFVKHIPPERPVLLLVDGHTTHIDLETSKFCKENGILLYCLLAHSSHITQPLDVGFFGALKTNWKKACDKFKISNMGSSVTKETFSSVFNTAWTSTVKMSTIVNSFARAGIYPINRNAIGKGGTIDPALLYSESTTDSSSLSSGSVEPGTSTSTSVTLKSGVSSSLDAIESLMEPATITKFQERFTEGYDVAGDELYAVWEQLKKMSLSNSTALCAPHTSTVSSTASGSITTCAVTSTVSTTVSTVTASKTATSLTSTNVSTTVSSATGSSSSTAAAAPKPSSVLAEILTYPDPIRKKTKSRKGKGRMPDHLNSSQFIAFMEEEKQKKADEEAEKARRMAEREAKKAQKEQERLQKKALADAKKANKAAQKKPQKKAPSRRRKKTPPPVSDEEESESSTEDQRNRENCPECDGEVESTQWVACDHCEQWYHVECTSISPSSYSVIEDIEWVCTVCCQ